MMANAKGLITLEKVQVLQIWPERGARAHKSAHAPVKYRLYLN